jgi:Holliday junction DNA helicase RuvA
MPEVEMPAVEGPEEDFKGEVVAVLVEQLGHTRSEAQRMVQAALIRRPEVKTAEELFEEVYRGEKA